MIISNKIKDLFLFFGDHADIIENK